MSKRLPNHPVQPVPLVPNEELNRNEKDGPTLWNIMGVLEELSLEVALIRKKVDKLIDECEDSSSDRTRYLAKIRSDQIKNACPNMRD